MKPYLKLLIEIGPLVAFFVVNGRGGLPEFRDLWITAGSEHAQQGLFEATGAFMIVTILALIAGWALEHKLPVMPLVSGIFVLGFGGLTLILADEFFIKIKPTIVNSLFAVILLGGLATGRSLLKPLLGSTIDMVETGWRTLTLRWGIFFIVLAVMNEVVWRNFSTEFWAGFKLFGVMPLTIIFALAQTPLILRFQREPHSPADVRAEIVEETPVD